MLDLRLSRSILFGLLLVFVGPPSDSQTLAQAKKEAISIGYASPSGVFMPLFIAQEQGLFRKYGLNVKELLLLRGTGPAAAQMLVAGAAPIEALGGALVEAAVHGGGFSYSAIVFIPLIFS